jgi:hypothetical protein
MAVLVSLKDLLKVLRENPVLATEDNEAITNAARVLQEVAAVPVEVGISYLCERPYFPSIGHQNGVLGMTLKGVFYPLVSDAITVKQNETLDKSLWYCLTYTVEIDDEEDIVEFSTLLRSGSKNKDIVAASKINVVEEGEEGEEGYSKKITYAKPNAVTAVYFPIPFDGQEGEFTIVDTSDLKSSSLIDLGSFSAIVEKGIVKNGDIVTLKEGKVFLGTREISISGGSVEKMDLEVNKLYLVESFSVKPNKAGTGYTVKVRIGDVEYWSEPNLTRLLKAASNSLPVWVKCDKVIDKISKEKQLPYKAYSFKLATKKEIEAYLAEPEEVKAAA